MAAQAIHSHPEYLSYYDVAIEAIINIMAVMALSLLVSGNREKTDCLWIGAVVCCYTYSCLELTNQLGDIITRPDKKIPTSYSVPKRENISDTYIELWIFNLFHARPIDLGYSHFRERPRGRTALLPTLVLFLISYVHLWVQSFSLGVLYIFLSNLIYAPCQVPIQFFFHHSCLLTFQLVPGNFLTSFSSQIRDPIY